MRYGRVDTVRPAVVNTTKTTGAGDYGTAVRRPPLRAAPRAGNTIHSPNKATQVAGIQEEDDSTRKKDSYGVRVGSHAVRGWSGVFGWNHGDNFAHENRRQRMRRNLIVFSLCPLVVATALISIRKPI